MSPPPSIARPLLAVALVLTSWVRLAGAAGGVEPSSLVAANALGPGWRVAGLPRQKPPLTRFTPVQVDGREALRIEAEASYGNVVFDLPEVPVAGRRLRWQWRVEEPNRAVDLTAKAGDDTAAKVCAAFDLPTARLSFAERTLLVIARRASGEKLPAATLCYVWGEAEARGRVVPNVYSRRVRYLVLRNRDDALAAWHAEDRDLAADFQLAFGDEAAEVPPLVALIVGADADNTASRSAALVAGLRLAP